MTNPIVQAIERLDAACPCWLTQKSGSWCCDNFRERCTCYKRPVSLPKSIKLNVSCRWPGHRLARELAKAVRNKCHEIARKEYRNCPHEGVREIAESIAALPPEGVEDD